MRKLPILALLTLVAVTEAQQGRRSHRMRDPVGGRPWILDDWGQAQLEAKRKGKPIFAVFRCVP